MIRKSPFIIIVSLLLITGFIATTVISYLLANRSFIEQVRTYSLPLTSDNIYSEIQRDLLQPILVSSLMAQDTFVRDWAVRGENNPNEIIRYLKSIQQRYQAITSFYISEQSKNYYHSTGILKQVSKNNPGDAWYFRVEKLKSDFEINLDKDSAAPERTTFFVNHKVHDFNGEFLGVIGVGLSSELIMHSIENYQTRYDRQVYFSDKTGNIVLHGAALSEADNIHSMSGIKAIATKILNNESGSYRYKRGNENVFLTTRFVPELNWYLLVEQKQQANKQALSALWINLCLSTIISLIILWLIVHTFNYYQHQIKELANRDHLTQTASRNSFETSFQQMILFATRRKKPLSVLLVDIDHFKSVNDTYGHLAGDHVLAKFASILSSQLRKSDSICRWGGEEFLIVLPDCNLSYALEVSEKMRSVIENTVIASIDKSITASFGVAELRSGEVSQELFDRADKALYEAKAKGRNCVITSTG